MKYRKCLAILLSSALVWAGLAGAANAAVISTSDAFALERTAPALTGLQATMARLDVQQAMVSMGVDPAEAQLRVAALSDAELAELQGRLDELPAGGILALIGAVFVVLLILEYTGVIDIFKKT